MKCSPACRVPSPLHKPYPGTCSLGSVLPIGTAPAVADLVAALNASVRPALEDLHAKFGLPVFVSGELSLALYRRPR